MGLDIGWLFYQKSQSVGEIQSAYDDIHIDERLMRLYLSDLQRCVDYSK